MSPSPSDQARSPALSLSKWFAEEVQPHEPALRGFVHGLLKPADVDDLVQKRLRSAASGPRARPD